MTRRTTWVATALALGDVAVLAETAAPAWHVVTGAGWPATHDADRLAAAIAQTGLFLVGVWLAVGLLACAATSLPGALGYAARLVHVRLMPVAVRRLLAGTAGVGVLLAPAGAATAAAGHLDGTPRPVAVAPSPVPPPLWPTDGPAHHAGRPATGRSVTVAEGDSLWSLAAERLGRGAGDARIAGYWPRIYRANRAVIGDDPDLVLPGLRLTLPAPVHPAKETHR